VFAKLKEKK
jgi:hypothetical protein